MTDAATKITEESFATCFAKVTKQELAAIKQGLAGLGEKEQLEYVHRLAKEVGVQSLDAPCLGFRCASHHFEQATNISAVRVATELASKSCKGR